MQPVVIVARYLTSLDDTKPEMRIFRAGEDGINPVTDFVLWLRRLDT